MAKLIDAEAFRAIMYQRCMVEDSEDQKWDSGCWIRYRLFEKTLEEMPPAQPERKTGRWIHDGYDFPHGNDWIHCSVCGKRGINVPADLSKYCPNCGAKMEEGDGN